MQRLIKIYSTKGTRYQEITTDATTYGELKRQCEGIDFQYTQGVISESDTSLVLDTAKLPDYPFTLFIASDIKINNGGGGNPVVGKRKDYLEYAKKEAAKGAEAKEFFWGSTRTSTQELERKIKEWKERKKASRNGGTSSRGQAEEKRGSYTKSGNPRKPYTKRGSDSSVCTTNQGCCSRDLIEKLGNLSDIESATLDMILEKLGLTRDSLMSKGGVDMAALEARWAEIEKLVNKYKKDNQAN